MLGEVDRIHRSVFESLGRGFAVERGRGGRRVRGSVVRLDGRLRRRRAAARIVAAADREAVGGAVLERVRRRHRNALVGQVGRGGGGGIRRGDAAGEGGLRVDAVEKGDEDGVFHHTIVADENGIEVLRKIIGIRFS